jgi:hypothetical protein
LHANEFITSDKLPAMESDSDPSFISLGGGSDTGSDSDGHPLDKMVQGSEDAVAGLEQVKQGRGQPNTGRLVKKRKAATQEIEGDSEADDDSEVATGSTNDGERQGGIALVAKRGKHSKLQAGKGAAAGTADEGEDFECMLPSSSDTTQDVAAEQAAPHALLGGGHAKGLPGAVNGKLPPPVGVLIVEEGEMGDDEGKRMLRQSRSVEVHRFFSLS